VLSPAPRRKRKRAVQRFELVPVRDPAVLRELAWLIEHRNPRPSAVAALSDAKQDELLAMLVDGKVPTIGWWRRAREASA
jgi:hypothetical protein